jgi:hypothetical protein
VKAKPREKRTVRPKGWLTEMLMEIQTHLAIVTGKRMEKPKD